MRGDCLTAYLGASYDKGSLALVIDDTGYKIRALKHNDQAMEVTISSRGIKVPQRQVPLQTCKWNIDDVSTGDIIAMGLVVKLPKWRELT